MKAFIFMPAILLYCFGLKAQQQETFYILVPRDQIQQQMINQLKAFSSDHEGKFMQDDTSTLSKIIFEEDTSQVYVILSWEGLQAPTSVSNNYHIDSVNVEHRIFTEGEIKEYISQNEHQAFPLLDE